MTIVWTTCSCGHIAQDHNLMLPYVAMKHVEALRNGYTDEIPGEDWLCDHCGIACKGYDGHKIEK